MATLKIHALTTAAILIALLTQPSLAATHTPRADAPQASQLDQVRRDYYSVYGNPGFNAYGQGEIWTHEASPAVTYPSQNLPYPDRPYGDPDKW